MPNLTPEQHETRQNTIFDLVEKLGQLDMKYAQFRTEIAANPERTAVTYKQLHNLVTDIFAGMQLYENSLPQPSAKRLTVT